MFSYHTKNIERGAHVWASSLYVGGGTFELDGAEGPWTVLGPLPPGDYYLARGHLTPEELEGRRWDIIMHSIRIWLTEEEARSEENSGHTLL